VNWSKISPQTKSGQNPFQFMGSLYREGFCSGGHVRDYLNREYNLSGQSVSRTTKARNNEYNETLVRPAVCEFLGESQICPAPVRWSSAAERYYLKHKYD